MDVGRIDAGLRRGPECVSDCVQVVPTQAVSCVIVWAVMWKGCDGIDWCGCVALVCGPLADFRWLRKGVLELVLIWACPGPSLRYIDYIKHFRLYPCSRHDQMCVIIPYVFHVA